MEDGLVSKATMLAPWHELPILWFEDSRYVIEKLALLHGKCIQTSPPVAAHPVGWEAFQSAGSGFRSRVDHSNRYVIACDSNWKGKI